MINSLSLLYSFIIFFTLSVLIKLYLLFRNMNSMKQNLNRVPLEFQGIISVKEHNKAQEYTFEKNMLSIISILFSAVCTLFWLFTGGLQILKEMSSISDSNVFNGTLFLIIFFFMNSLLSLPFSLYSTFGIEQKYGFNTTSLKLYLADLFKSSVFLLFFMAPILYAIILIHTKLGYLWWLYAWLALTTFQFFLVWAYPKFISPLFNKFSALDDKDLISEIDDLCVRSEISFKEYFVMDASKRSSHGNAYFTGFGRSRRIVFFDTLLSSLTINETIAVLAHELGHFKKKHIQKSMLLSTISLLAGLYILAWLGSSQFFYDAFLMDNSPEIAMALFIIISPSYTFLLTPLGSLFSRRNEFEADHFAAKNANASDLISALLKMYKDNASSLTPDPLYSQFYFSHPTAKERISSLKRYL